MPAIPRVATPPGRHLRLHKRGSTFVRYHRGPQDAPTLLLLHGWTATSDLNWSTSYSALAEHYSFVAIDMRGHGRGLRTNKAFKLEDCADDAALALDALGIDKVIVVGYSMGGAIAQLFWRRHHQRTTGLVLCATSATFNASPREKVLFSWITSIGLVARFTPAKIRNKAVVRYLKARTDEELRESAGREVTRHDWLHIIQAGTEIGRFDSRNWIAGVNIPAALVLTSEDVIVAPERQADLFSRIPKATLHPVYGGHPVCVNNPRRFVPVFIDALRSVESRMSKQN